MHKRRKGYGHIGKNSIVHTPSLCGYGQKNIYLGDNVTIDWGSTLFCDSAKFIMKDHSGAALGLTVVTGNHQGEVGEWQLNRTSENLVGKDIIVEEDVWLAANVTLLAGAHIGRGCIVGAGSVLRACSIPPYAIVLGNPAKVVGFRFLPEQIVEHEKALYSEKDRLPQEELEANYEKFFIERQSEILQFLR